ncbi:MAG: hypothetical protein U0570_14085 [Phycisphaerales bacterium]
MNKKTPHRALPKGGIDLHVQVRERLVVVKEKATGRDDSTLQLDPPVSNRLRLVTKHCVSLTRQYLAKTSTCTRRTDSVCRALAKEDGLRHNITPELCHHERQQRIIRLRVNRLRAGRFQELAKKCRRASAKFLNDEKLAYGCARVVAATADQPVTHGFSTDSKRVRNREAAAQPCVADDLGIHFQAVLLAQVCDVRG